MQLSPDKPLTVAELVDVVLNAIGNQFECYIYDRRAFHRDRNALMKAIARVGYTCEQNGWTLDAKECLQVVMTVLGEIKLRQADIKFLPIYLESAIGRHLGQKAEEYSLAQKARGAKRLSSVLRRTVDGVQKVDAIREKSATETLAALYGDLRLRARRRRKPAPLAKQSSLL